jgi:uncharacterized membrane protein
MDNVALAHIKTFGPAAPQADFESPSEQLITLTIGQLQDVIIQAVEKANQPLQDEVSQLRAIVARQDEKIAALDATVETQAENQLIQLRLINDLRETTRKDAQPLQKDRSEILRALLAANGGKMLAKDARQKMHLSRSRFSELLATTKNDIEVKPSRLNKRQNILRLL